MSLLLSILAIAGIAIGLASSLHSEKKRKLRRFAIAAAFLAILAVCAQYLKQHQDGATHQRELASAEDRHNQLKEQNNSLHAKVDSLVAAEQEMREMIAPILEIAKERSPGIDDRQAIQKLLEEISRRMHPKLVFLEDRTRLEQDNETGLYKTTYVYRSQYPVLVRDATVKLRFDCIVRKANGRLPNTLPFEGNSTLNIHPDGKGVTYYARTLGEGSDMILYVFTKAPPKIVSSELSP
jgi:apolipoprotein N-acyltransferase